MNYSLNHSRDLSRYWDTEDIKRAAWGRKRPKRPKGFKAKFAGRCATCRGSFGVGAQVTYNKAHKLVHSGGCPYKGRPG